MHTHRHIQLSADLWTLGEASEQPDITHDNPIKALYCFYEGKHKPLWALAAWL